MSIFSFKKRELVLVLDISSGSVGGAFVLCEAGSVPFILNSKRSHFRLSEEKNIERSKKEMLESLDAVCSELQREVGERPQKIFCILATPWSHGELHSVKIEKNTNFKFTEKLAQKLINDEIQKFKAGWKNLKQVIDKRITGVSLNGFSVKNPHGFLARTAKIDIFLSLAPEVFTKSIEEKIHKTFKAKIMFTSQMFSDFVVVRDIFDIENNFMVVNVGEAVTEIVIIKNDELVGTAFFPLGQNSLIFAIASKLGTGLAEARSLVNLFESGYLNDEEIKKTRDVIFLARENWLTEFKNVLIELSPMRYIPNHIFVSGTSNVQIFSEGLEFKSFPEFTTPHHEFHVIIGDNKMLHDYCDFSVNTERDSSITKKAIFINQSL